MEILDYTDKSFVVFGADTKDWKDGLKGLGGRYNPHLTHPTTKEKISGWIFSKKQKEKVEEFIRHPSNGKQEPIVVPVQEESDFVATIGRRVRILSENRVAYLELADVQWGENGCTMRWQYEI
jgi:hypothetical protein